MSSNQDGLFKKEGVGILVPFAMITLCFAMWGFANDVTSPMVKSFGLIFQMSTFESSFVQVAFYLGYFCMALPAALFIRRFSFKAGVVMGLALYALGVLAFVPARSTGTFMAFLPAYFVMTCGLSFLETSCNPYVYAMGSESTGTRRLNFAQAFNPVGALMGAMVALTYVSGSLDPTDGATRRQLLMADPLRFDAIKAHDLDILVQPYLYIGLVILAVLAAVVLTRMPSTDGTCDRKGVVSVFVQLLRTKNYREGVVAQFFYVGAQTVCWTYLMHYGHHVFYDLEGLGEAEAQQLTTHYYLTALALFAVGRFVCTWLLTRVEAGRLLAMLALAAIGCLVGVILIEGRVGLWCLVAVSGCMSLMFPTIYGMALTGVRQHLEFAGAGLVMSILGGSVVPLLQAAMMDSHTVIMGLTSVHYSFAVPLVCFAVVARYGLMRRHRQPKA